jgi:hypothetical protein
MEDTDFRTMELNGSNLKVFRDGRIHSLDNLRNTWTNRRYQLTKCGYYRVDIRRKKLCVHNVITLCYLGMKPEGYQTDRINNNPLDNRFGNLQYLPHVDNQRKRVMCNGKPIKGYRKMGNKYESNIGHLNKIIIVGYFGKKKMLVRHMLMQNLNITT